MKANRPFNRKTKADVNSKLIRNHGADLYVVAYMILTYTEGRHIAVMTAGVHSYYIPLTSGQGMRDR